MSLVLHSCSSSGKHVKSVKSVKVVNVVNVAALEDGGEIWRYGYRC